MLIFDPIGGLFYVAAQLEDIQRLLMALNGTLFPNRAFDAPFKILAVRLDQLQSVARGAHASKTYHAVTLKSLSGCDFGYNATRAKLDWAEDGFKAIALSANKWPPHAEEARLLIHVNEYKKPFTLTIYEGSGVIKAALSEKTFWAIAEVLRRCTGNYTEHYEVALPSALQREMDFTQSPALTRLKEVDNTPYIATEEEIPIECEAAPIKFKCSCTPYGRHSLKCCPYSQIDALQVAQTYRNDKSVHCVLFSVPKGASKIDPDGIVAWAEEASKFVSKPIHAYEPGQKFPCGNAPYCKQHAETEEQEDQEKLKHLIDIYGTYSSNVKNGFKGLKHKALLTIHLWSSEEDPEKKGHPISIPSLADIFEVTPDAIYYTLRKAKKVNAKLYKKMEYERNKRAEETHGYIVDSNTPDTRNDF